jgi:hypothetical protein
VLQPFPLLPNGFAYHLLLQSLEQDYVHTVSQAYTQAEDDLDRLVAIEAPEEMGLVDELYTCVYARYTVFLRAGSIGS